MIACPRCSSLTLVVETRGDRRRRVCPKCLARFTTTESSVAERPASTPPRKGGRRSISFARAEFDAAKEVAAAENMPLSAWMTKLIRAAIPGLAVVAPVVETTRSELDAMAAARKQPPPGMRCANCIDAPATQRGRVDREGPEYWLCDECPLPDDADGRRRRTA